MENIITNSKKILGTKGILQIYTELKKYTKGGCKAASTFKNIFKNKEERLNLLKVSLLLIIVFHNPYNNCYFLYFQLRNYCILLTCNVDYI